MSYAPNINTISQIVNVTAVAGGTTYTALTWGLELRVNAALGSVTINLPTALGNASQRIDVLRLDASANTVTIAPFGAQTIGGQAAASITETGQNVNYEFVSTGAVVDVFIPGGAAATSAITLARVLASNTSSQAIPNATPTTVTNWTTTVDSTASFVQGSGLFTAPRTARYRVQVSALFVAGAWIAGNQGNIEIDKNGLAVAAGGTFVQVAGSYQLTTGECSAIIDCIAGDVISARLNQTSGVVKTLSNNGTYTTLFIEELPPTLAAWVNFNDQSAFSGASGYVDIGAMRIQWGQSTTSGAALVVTFPAPFANTTYQWTGTVNLGSTTANYIGMTYSSKALGSITVFGQQFNTGSSTIIAAGGQTFSWIAIGLHP